MNKKLERAFAEAAKLPEREQDAMAEWILAEIASDRAWERALGNSGDKLERMAADAFREHREGRTEALDPEKS